MSLKSRENARDPQQTKAEYIDSSLYKGQGSIGKGVWSGEGEVDASLMMTTLDLQQMLSGKLKPFQAYMRGRLRVSGDLAAALRLETFVDRVVAQAKSR